MNTKDQFYDLTDAFLALNELDDSDVAGMIDYKMKHKKQNANKKLTEGKQFSVNAGSLELEEAEKFLNQQATEPELEVIDVDADSLDHLQNKEEYIGQAILRCNQCRANRFIDLDKLVVSEEDANIYNVEDECPHCRGVGSGYELIGQVGKLDDPVQEVVPESEEAEVADDIEEPADVNFENDGEQEEAQEEQSQKDQSEEGQSEEESDEDEPQEDEDYVEEEDDGMETYTSEDDDLDLPSLDDEEDDKDKKESLGEALNQADIVFEDVDWKVVEVKDYESFLPFSVSSKWSLAKKEYFDDELKQSNQIFIYEDKHSGEIFLAKLKNDKASYFDRMNNSVNDIEIFGAPSLDEVLAKPLKEALHLNKYAQEAWMLNEVISHLNDEEAYYGTGWLWLWPDGESKEECSYDFDNAEALEELKDEFIGIYKHYHESGLYNAPKNVEDFAHKMDAELGLRKIDNLKDQFMKENLIKESFDCKVPNDIFHLMVEPNSIKKILAYDVSEDDNRLVFEGLMEDLPTTVAAADCIGYNVDNGRLTCNVDTDDKSGITTVKSVLDKFNDDDTEKIDIWDEAQGDSIFTGTKQEVLDKFGDIGFVSFQTPATVNLFVKAPAVYSAKELHKSEQDTVLPIDKLISNIIKANNLSENKLDRINSTEYWIKESLYTGEDAKWVYEHFVRDLNNNKLNEEFEAVTGYAEVETKAYSEGYKQGLKESKAEQAKRNLSEGFNASDFDKFMKLCKKLNLETLADIKKFSDKHGKVTDKKLLDALAKEAEKISGHLEESNKRDKLPQEYVKKEEKQILKKVATQLKKPGVFAVIAGFDQGSGIIYLDTPVVKKTFDELQDFEKAFRRGKESSKVRIITYYPRHLKEIERQLKMNEEAEEIPPVAEAADEMKKWVIVAIPDEENMQFLKRKEKVIKAKDYDEACDIAFDEFAEYHEIGVYEVKDESMLESRVTSFKTRKELSEAIQEYKNNSRPYTIKRSTTDGYRYDLVEEVPLTLVNRGGRTSKSTPTDVLDPNMSEAEVNLIKRIQTVAQDISEAIEKYYQISADPKLIVADIIQDLRLVSGAISIDDLEDTPMNNATKALYQSYEGFYEFVDQIMSELTGTEIHSTNESKFKDALQTLASPSFEKEAIEKSIASPRFLQAVSQGLLPYIPSDATPKLIEEVEFDEKEFDNDINNYFNEAYDETIIYTSLDGTVDENGEIVLEGLLNWEDRETPITFKLTPEKPLTESLDEVQNKEAVLEKTTYKVTNNISEEIFSFERNN